VAGNTVINDPMYARDLALAGIGLALVMEPVVRAVALLSEAGLDGAEAQGVKDVLRASKRS
jgi:hypothetical protein